MIRALYLYLLCSNALLGVWCVAELFRALSLAGLGLALLCGLVAWLFAAWCRRTPLLPHNPNPGATRGALIVLSSILVPDLAGDAVSLIGALAVVFAVLGQHPPRGLRRRLRAGVAAVRRVFARPVMGAV